MASTVIHGLGYIPPFGDGLSDEDIAEIASYIRNRWGNDFGLLTVEQVAAKR